MNDVFLIYNTKQAEMIEGLEISIIQRATRSLIVPKDRSQRRNEGKVKVWPTDELAGKAEPQPRNFTENWEENWSFFWFILAN